MCLLWRRRARNMSLTIWLGWSWGKVLLYTQKKRFRVIHSKSKHLRFFEFWWNGLSSSNSWWKTPTKPSIETHFLFIGKAKHLISRWVKCLNSKMPNIFWKVLMRAIISHGRNKIKSSLLLPVYRFYPMWIQSPTNSSICLLTKSERPYLPT